MELTDAQREIIALSRRLGIAEGLLIGWLYADASGPEHIDHCKRVTREFLDEKKTPNA